MMKSHLILIPAILLILAGCNKSQSPPTPKSADTVSNAATQSVAAPPSAIPPSDASITPPAPQGTAGANGSGATQANPKELTKQEEASAMPLPGQVNNHSTPVTTGESSSNTSGGTSK